MMVQSYGQLEEPTNTGAIDKNEKLHNIKMLARCERDYVKLIKKNTSLQNCIENILTELKLRPYMGEKLFANFPGCRSIHFRGNDYRIIYRIIEKQEDQPEPEILILEIGHRSSSYADLAKRLGQGK